MLTSFNNKAIANAYSISTAQLYTYLHPQRKKIDALKTKIEYIIGKKKAVRKMQRYSTEALQFIVFEIMKDTPEGYEWNGKTLVRIPEERK